MRPSKASSGQTRQVQKQGRVKAYKTSAQCRGPGLKETWKGPGETKVGLLCLGKKRREEESGEKQVAQRHQMVSGSLALLHFLLGFHGGRQGSGPDGDKVL